MGLAHDVAGLADEAVARLKADLERVLTRLAAYLDALVRQAAQGDTRIGQAQARELAAKLGAQFAETLGRLGYDKSIRGVIDAFDAVADMGQANLGEPFSTLNGRSLASLVDGTVDNLLALKGEAGATLREIVLVAGTSNAPVADLVATLTRAAGITLRQAVTQASTALMAFHRQGLQAEAGDAGVDLYTYDGPDDDIVRPFCERHVGKVYTVADLDAEDNGQGLEPTSKYLGGYNCRHSLSPITLEEARALPPHMIGGREARAIVLRGKTGAAEAKFLAENRGAVAGGAVVRRRRAG